MRRLFCALLLLSAAITFLAVPAGRASASTRTMPDGRITIALAPAPDPDAHQDHLEHQAHMAWVKAHQQVTVTTAARQGTAPSGFPGYGLYSFSMLERVWIWAGGPADVAWAAATIAECESGGKTWAYNPSGASGLWQILGVPWPGNPWDGPTNARMAVTKFRDAGGFSPWVCQA